MSPMRMRSGQPVSPIANRVMEMPRRMLFFFIDFVPPNQVRNGFGRANWTWPHEPTSRTPNPTISWNHETAEKMPTNLGFMRQSNNLLRQEASATCHLCPVTCTLSPVVVNVEIVTIGNEVLLGLVQDTNSNYLCRVVRGMGGRVRHIAVVRDEIGEIAEELRASIARRAEVIFTCGGLGPTDDDLTLAGVAAAVIRPLELNPAAREFVARRFRELAAAGDGAEAALSDARVKTARLPVGARPIDNPAGAAPAMAIEVNLCRIISLPGVPSELKAIIEGPLQGLLNEVFGRG